MAESENVSGFGEKMVSKRSLGLVQPRAQQGVAQGEFCLKKKQINCES